MRKNLRTALKARERLLATFLLLPRVEVVELLALAGFNAVIVDLEHGPMTVAELPELAAAAQGQGVYAIARVGDSSAAEIGKALDTGVDGVMVPHVSSVEDARRLVAAGRYGPEGERSINPYTRGNGYDLGRTESSQEVDDRVALIAMLEGNEVLGRIGEICAVPGLDAVFVGPVDLSASLGLPGETEHPSVVAAVQEALVRIDAAGCSSGVYASSATAGARWFSLGSSLVAVSADTALALRSFAETRAAVGSALAGALAGLDGSASAVSAEPAV